MLFRKISILFLLFLTGFVIVGCQTTTLTNTTELTTPTTSQSNTTETQTTTTQNSSTTSTITTTETTTLPTTTNTTAVLSNSPLPSQDTRSSAVYEGKSIIVDNTHREFTYRNARFVEKSNDETIYGLNYVDSMGQNRFIGSFSPIITTAGYYKIYINYPQLTNPATEVVLQIDYAGGNRIDSTKTINQSMNAGYWVMIGTYYLSSGEGNAVHIFGVNGYDVAADAVLFDLSVGFETTDFEDELTLRNPKRPGSVANILLTREREFRYSVNGELFFMKGVAGVDALSLMAEAGANSVRTYSIDHLRNGAVLDEAHALGIKVVIGLWMNHESANFTYHDHPSLVQDQYLRIIADVEKYKTHPALLAWSVGNEVDISTSKNPIAIYHAINAIAKYIHETDPYHPTMAVLAGSSVTKINNIARYSPHIDIIGINTYKHIGNVESNISTWAGPYAITEYALDQPMETTLRTSWGAIIEPKSIDKANLYYSRYVTYILNKQDTGCIGSFVFKDVGGFRITHTWYGLVYNNLRTPQFYAMKSAWNETERIPSLSIESVLIGGRSLLENVTVKTGSTQTIVVKLDNPSGGALTYQLEVKKEVALSTNSIPPVRTDFSIESLGQPGTYSMTVGQETAGFRLFVYVSSDLGEVTTFSFPFYVSSDLFVFEDQPNIQVIRASSESGYLESGLFQDSSNRFYMGNPTRFTRELDAYAEFQNPFTIATTAKVYYYNLSSYLTSDDYQIEITIRYANQQTFTTLLAITAMPEGWIELGQFAFDGNPMEFVRITKIMNSTLVVRSTAVAFLPI